MIPVSTPVPDPDIPTILQRVENLELEVTAWRAQCEMRDQVRDVCAYEAQVEREVEQKIQRQITPPHDAQIQKLRTDLASKVPTLEAAVSEVQAKVSKVEAEVKGV